MGSWIDKRMGSAGRVWQLPSSHEQIVAGFNRSYNRVTFVSATMLFPRSVGIAVPNRTRFTYFEDRDQLCRLAESGMVEFRNVPAPLYTYNIRPKGSKGQGDWSRHNVFERACRARRRAGLAEWSSLEEFEAFLSRSLGQSIRWRGIRKLLTMKVYIENLRTSAIR